MMLLISKNHGVNPSVDTCFFCGEAIGVVLFGKMNGDAEAPRESVTSYEPCDDCKLSMASGFALVEAVDEPQTTNQPSIGKDNFDHLVYPTGRWAVLKNEAAEKFFGESVVGKKRALACGSVMDYLFEIGTEGNDDFTPPCTDERELADMAEEEDKTKK